MKQLVYLVFLVAFMPSIAHATIQRADQVIIDGEHHYLFGEPIVSRDVVYESRFMEGWAPNQLITAESRAD